MQTENYDYMMKGIRIVVGYLDSSSEYLSRSKGGNEGKGTCWWVEVPLEGVDGIPVGVDTEETQRALKVGNEGTGTSGYKRGEGVGGSECMLRDVGVRISCSGSLFVMTEVVDIGTRLCLLGWSRCSLCRSTYC